MQWLPPGLSTSPAPPARPPAHSLARPHARLPLTQAHIWLMIIGWGFFAPLGVACARVLKEFDPVSGGACLAATQGLAQSALEHWVSH